MKSWLLRKATRLRVPRGTPPRTCCRSALRGFELANRGEGAHGVDHLHAGVAEGDGVGEVAQAASGEDHGAQDWVGER